MTPAEHDANERSAVAFMASTATWVKRGPRVLVAAFALMTGIASSAAWFGAQASSPGVRISQVEGSVSRLGRRVDTVVYRLDSLKVETQRGQAERAALRNDLTLLLRLNCRPITDPDLRADCIDRVGRRP